MSDRKKMSKADAKKRGEKAAKTRAKKCSRGELQSCTIEKLKAKLKRAGIIGTSHMDKKAMINAVIGHQAGRLGKDYYKKHQKPAVGSRAQVWHGNAAHTSGGLKKGDLMKNKEGRIVSKTKHAAGKALYKKYKSELAPAFKKGAKPHNKGKKLGKDGHYHKSKRD